MLLSHVDHLLTINSKSESMVNTALPAMIFSSPFILLLLFHIVVIFSSFTVGSIPTKSAETREFNCRTVQNQSSSNVIHHCDGICFATYSIYGSSVCARNVAAKCYHESSRGWILCA